MIISIDSSKPFRLQENEDCKETKCFFCGEHGNSRIFYEILGQGNCICSNCEHNIKGMFKDYLIADAKMDEQSLREKLDSFCKETVEQLHRLKIRGSFSFYAEVNIVDDFDETYTLDEIKQMNAYASYKYEICFKQMKSKMKELFNEEPFSVKFFYTEDYYDRDYKKENKAICGIAKTYNNGSSVIFGDSKLALKNCKYVDDDTLNIEKL